MKSPIFLIITPTFQLQIHYRLYFRSYSRKYTYFRYTNFNYVFSQQPHPQCHILIFALGEKVKSNLEVKLCRRCLLRVKVNQFRVENTLVKMSTTLFKGFDTSTTLKCPPRSFAHWTLTFLASLWTTYCGAAPGDLVNQLTDCAAFSLTLFTS